MKPAITFRDMVLRFGLIFIVFGLLLTHARYYMPFFADDALISLRYADRLIHGLGLTWTSGRPVEGYSNLLWTLLIAALGKGGMDLIAAARLLGVVCMAAVIVFAAALHLSRRDTARVFGFAAGMIFFVCAAPIAVWSIGGLEQPLVAAALAGAIFFFSRAAESEFKNRAALLALSFILGMLCLTRPDGPLFTVAMIVSLGMAGLPLGSHEFRRAAVVTASFPILCYAGQLLFRLHYYGEWIPNTALVKLVPSSHHLIGGLEYAGKGLLSLMPASLIAIIFMIGGVRRPETRARFAPLLVLFLFWLLYVIAIGGDILPAYRHMVPVVVILSFAIMEGASLLIAITEDVGSTRTAVAGFLIVTGIAVLPIQFLFEEYSRAKNEHWEWEGRSLALTLKDAFGSKQPLVGVTAAGCVPYWSGFDCVDMLGLNDYYLPRHKPPATGSGLIGHELGDPDYVLQRAPDIIVFTAGGEPMFHYRGAFSRNGKLSRAYARMPLRTAHEPEFVGIVWFRKDSPKLGFRREGDTLIIPAWFLNAHRYTCATIQNGRVAVGVNADHPAGVVLEDLPATIDVKVLGPRPDLIQTSTTLTNNRTRITLSTQSKSGVPVEGIVVTTRSAAN